MPLIASCSLTSFSTHILSPSILSRSITSSIIHLPASSIIEGSIRGVPSAFLRLTSIWNISRYFCFCALDVSHIIESILGTSIIVHLSISSTTFIAPYSPKRVSFIPESSTLTQLAGITLFLFL